jgi:hypothetical protein
LSDFRRKKCSCPKPMLWFHFLHKHVAVIWDKISDFFLPICGKNILNIFF